MIQLNIKEEALMAIRITSDSALFWVNDVKAFGIYYFGNVFVSVRFCFVLFVSFCFYCSFVWTVILGTNKHILLCYDVIYQSLRFSMCN